MDLICEKVKVSFKCTFKFDIKQGGSSPGMEEQSALYPSLTLQVKVRVDQIKEYVLKWSKEISYKWGKICNQIGAYLCKYTFFLLHSWLCKLEPVSLLLYYM